MTLIVALLVGTAAGLLVPGNAPARRRLRRLSAASAEAAAARAGAAGARGDAGPDGAASRGASRPRWRLVAATSAAGGVGLFVTSGHGASGGLVTGILVALVAFTALGRLEPRAVARRRQRLVADLPVALDLLAACLTAGSPLPQAVAGVAHAVGGPLGAELRRVVAVFRLGGSPAAAWSGLVTPELAAVARTLARGGDSGASLADTLAEAARGQRERARFAAEERAHRAGVHAVAPLGLCFLPAFVLVGVVPVVVGLLGGLLPA